MFDNETMSERDRLLWAEHARQAAEGNARSRRVTDLLSRRKAKGARWKSAQSVAHLAAGHGMPLEAADLKRELLRLMHTIRLGELLTRNGRPAVLLTISGMLPFRMSAAMAEREMSMWGDDHAVELFMSAAWLPEWAWRIYLSKAKPSPARSNPPEAQRQNNQPPAKRGRRANVLPDLITTIELDITLGVFTLDELKQEKQQSLAERYDCARRTVETARNEVLRRRFSNS